MATCGGRHRRAVGHRGARSNVERELADLDAVESCRNRRRTGGEYTHLALIPTYTEPLEKLRETVRALAEAEWPAERKICAIITRETDDRRDRQRGGPARGVRRRRSPSSSTSSTRSSRGSWSARAAPWRGAAVSCTGSSSASAAWTRRRILVTDLDADYRVHPQYFTYLAWTHVTDPNRETQLYQPIPYFHNNIWQAPMLTRLFAAVLTQLQMWRSVLPEKLQSFGSYSTTLHMVHEVGYWATDAIPEDSRFYWKSYFPYGDRFRAVPLFIPIYGDAVRASGYWRIMASQYIQARRWAWGVTDIPFVIQNAIRHTEIPLWSRVWRILNLFGEHINWAIAPFVMTFGAAVPLFLNPAFARDDPGPEPAALRASMLTLALVALVVLIWVEHRIVPPRPAEWGPLQPRPELRAVDRPAVRRHLLQQPARARRADAAADRPIPRVPGHREGLRPMPPTVAMAPIPLARGALRLLAAPLDPAASPACVAVAGGLVLGGLRAWAGGRRRRRRRVGAVPGAGAADRAPERRGRDVAPRLARRRAPLRAGAWGGHAGSAARRRMRRSSGRGSEPSAGRSGPAALRRDEPIELVRLARTRAGDPRPDGPGPAGDRAALRAELLTALAPRRASSSAWTRSPLARAPLPSPAPTRPVAAEHRAEAPTAAPWNRRRRRAC